MGNKSIYAAVATICFALGGGGGAWAGSARAEAEMDKLDDRLTAVERKQDVVINELSHIREDLNDAEERDDRVLELLEKIVE
jgi:hypothetical protein